MTPKVSIMEKSVCIVLAWASLIIGVSKSDDHCGPDTVFGPEKKDQIFSASSPNFKFLLSTTEDTLSSCVNTCCKTDMCNIMSYNKSAFIDDAINCFLYTCLPVDDECYFENAVGVVSLALLPRDNSVDTASVIGNEKIHNEVDTTDGPQRDKETFSDHIVDVINNTFVDLDSTNPSKTTKNTVSSTLTRHTPNPSSLTSSSLMTSKSDKSTINLAAKTTSNTVPSSALLTNTSTLKSSTNSLSGQSSPADTPVGSSSKSTTTSGVIPTSNNASSPEISKSVSVTNVTNKPSLLTKTVSQNIVNNTEQPASQEQQNVTNHTSLSPSLITTSKPTSKMNISTHPSTISQLKPPLASTTNVTTTNAQSPTAEKSSTTKSSPTTTTTTTTTTTPMRISNETTETIKQHDITTHILNVTNKQKTITHVQQETAQQQASTKEPEISTQHPETTTESLKENTSINLENEKNMTSFSKANTHLPSTGDLNITFADSTLKEEKEESSVLSTALIAVLSFGILFFFAVLVLLGRRCFDSWQRRHYSRVDYLVNGMYN